MNISIWNKLVETLEKNSTFEIVKNEPVTLHYLSKEETSCYNCTKKQEIFDLSGIIQIENLSHNISGTISIPCICSIVPRFLPIFRGHIEKTKIYTYDRILDHKNYF